MVKKQQKTLVKVMGGKSDANISFADMLKLVVWLGFEKSGGSGSHDKYSMEDVVEIIDLQEVKGGKCKPYQVRQVRTIVKKYGLD